MRQTTLRSCLGALYNIPMAPNGDGTKRQRIAPIASSALANIDVVGQLASFLEAKDLCQVKATCKALGSANDEAAFNGLSMADEAARRVYEGATDEEKVMLPRYEGESWIGLYHHLLMLRSRLTFDQLVGRYVEYQDDEKMAIVKGKKANGERYCSAAICGNHIMRAGKHWTTFTSSSRFQSLQDVGVIRPLPGWEKRGLDWFTPAFREFYADLLRERIERWEGNVHFCQLVMDDGICVWYDWTGDLKHFFWEAWNDYD